MTAVLQPFQWSRAVSAIEKVTERRARTSAILSAAGIPYAVIGGNAVQAWVSRVDEAAIRFTRDVDILLRRKDLPRAIEAEGFIFRHARGIDMFLDVPGSKARDAVRVLIANEPVSPDDPVPSPDPDDSVETETFRALDPEKLVQMKLVVWRDKDRTHRRDFIDVEIIAES